MENMLKKRLSEPVSEPIRKLKTSILKLRMKYSIPKLYRPKDEDGKTTLKKR